MLMSAALLFFLAASQTEATFLDDLFGGDDDKSSSSSESSELDIIGPWLKKLLFGAPKCGPADKCPNYDCKQNPAVVHGYCCGCASPFDSIRIVPCPGNLQCPLFREPLCHDYRYMIDCCCKK